MKMMQRVMALMPGYISCKELDEKLDDYVEGDLSIWNRFRFAMHLTICKACAAYAAGYRKTVGLLKSSVDSDINQTADEDVPEALVQDIVKKQLDSSGS